MLLFIQHETNYSYSHRLDRSVQIARLTPRIDAGQRTLRWQLQSPGRQLEQVDAFGNITHLITVDEPLEEINVIADGVIETRAYDGWIATEEAGLSPLAYLAPTELSEPDDAIRALASRWSTQNISSPDALLDLGSAIREAVVWEEGSTTVEHDAAQALALGRGVCQDHAHLFTSTCRLLGLPARYVSGYFHTGEASPASHAWGEAWLGAERGWFSVDITHGTAAGERHCRLAVGRDYLDAGPIRGVRHGGGDEALRVAVNVSRSRGPRRKRKKRDWQQ
jgi:transglutaminase-like putative cysteine protease